MSEKNLIEQIGGRKFILAIIVLLIGFALALDGKIDFDQFMKMAVLALGIFSAANAVQKLGNVRVNNYPVPVIKNKVE